MRPSATLSGRFTPAFARAHSGSLPGGGPAQRVAPRLTRVRVPVSDISKEKNYG